MGWGTPQVVARAEERKNAALKELDDAKEQIGALQEEALLSATKAAAAEAIQAAAESRATVAEETAEKNSSKAIADAQAALQAAVSDRDEVCAPHSNAPHAGHTHTQFEKQGVGKVEHLAAAR